MTEIVIRSFARQDQNPVRTLILSGLAEHFEDLDPTLNCDLEDIWTSYIDAGALFLVAEDGFKLVGTGALICEPQNRGRIVRLSVAAEYRRQGIGRLLVQKLVELAQENGYSSVNVETNDDWDVAIKLYQSCGFVPEANINGEIHLLYVFTNET